MGRGSRKAKLGLGFGTAAPFAQAGQGTPPQLQTGVGGVRGKQHWMSLDDPGPLSLSGLSSVSRGHSPAVKGWGRDLLGPSGWISPSQASRPGPGSPLLGLHVHHQGDVALDEGEGEEADVTTVIAGRQGVLRSVGRGRW